MNTIEKSTKSYKLSLVERTLSECLSLRMFLISDIAGLTHRLNHNVKSIVEIVTIEVMRKNKGLGSKLITKIVANYSSSIILLKAEPLYDTYELYEQSIIENTHSVKLERICNFYKRNGFVSINSIVGYQGADAFIYNNMAAKPIINAIFGPINKTNEVYYG